MRELGVNCINGVSYRMKTFLILLYFDYMNLLIICYPEDVTVILLGQLRMASNAPDFFYFDADPDPASHNNAVSFGSRSF
jgi:hypothetical protein